MPELRQPDKNQRTRGGARSGEEGYILIAVLFLVALLLIGLAVAAPRMAKSIQRDKEIELVHRGEQYKHAIKLYYRKFGTYPTSIDQLLNTNNIRFLRKRYTDPITGKDDWRLIHLGQAKVPPLGFFGQPLSGIPGAANVGTPVSATTGVAAGTSMTGTNAFGASPTSTFGTTSENTPDSSSDSSDTDNSTSDNSSTNPSVTFTGSNPEPVAPGPTSPPTGNSGTTGFGSTSTGTSGFGSGPTLGGGPIVGVGIPNTKASLLDYKKQDHYNKWEFVYNPIEDQMKAAGMLGAGSGSVNGSSTTSTSPFGGTTNTSSPFGNNSNSNTFGSGSSSFGSSTSGTTTSPMGSSPQ